MLDIQDYIYRIITFLQKWGSKDFRSQSDIRRKTCTRPRNSSVSRSSCLPMITAQQTRSLKQSNPSIHPLEFSPQWWEETPVKCGHPDWQNSQIHTAWKVPRQSEFQLRWAGRTIRKATDLERQKPWARQCVIYIGQHWSRQIYSDNILQEYRNTELKITVTKSLLGTSN